MPVDHVDKKEPTLQEQKRPRYKHKKSAIAGLASFIHAYKNEQKTNRKQDASEDIGKKWREISTLVFVILTTFGIFIQAFIFYRTDKTTRDALVDVQRAFVTSNDIKIEPTRDNNNKIVSWRIIPIVKNSGSTPTKNLQYYASGASGSPHDTDIIGPTYPIGENPSVLDPDQGYYNSISNPPSPDARLPRLVLGPQATANMGWVEFTADQLRQMSIGKHKVYIAATIHYWDIFDSTNEHSTKFCYDIRSEEDVSGNLRPTYDLCSYWNCADDECKEDKKQYRAYVARAFKSTGKPVPSDFYSKEFSYLIMPTIERASIRSQELARAIDMNFYLHEKSKEAAFSRSAELLQAVACQPQPACDPITKYLLDVWPLEDGTAVIVIPKGTVNGVVGSNKNGVARLTREEQQAIQTASQIGAAMKMSDAPLTLKLTDNTAAIALPVGQTGGLTVDEIRELKTREQIDDLLPERY